MQKLAELFSRLYNYSEPFLYRRILVTLVAHLWDGNRVVFDILLAGKHQTHAVTYDYEIVMKDVIDSEITLRTVGQFKNKEQFLEILTKLAIPVESWEIV
jgi:hypothetical protein